MKTIQRLIILLVCVGMIATSAIAAESDDGFVSEKEYKSYFFNIYAKAKINKDKVVMEMYSPPSLTALIRKSISMFDPNTIAGVFDVLYMAVAEIMDMRLKEFNCNVKICGNTEEFEMIKKNINSQDITQKKSFYVPENNTIYINSDNLDISTVGYAMSSAIQNNFFVVPAPKNLQEITAGYVESELKRYMRNKI